MKKQELEVIYLLHNLKTKELELLQFYIQYELKLRKERYRCSNV